MSLPTKICLSCGRSFTWRKKWERDWENVKYCSNACKRAGAPGDAERALEAAILDLLEHRDRGATICPSEVARAVAPDDWRPLMEPVRRAARRLVAEGRLEILQGGRVVDPDTARGAIRLRRFH
jgi:hypothetical protein